MKANLSTFKNRYGTGARLLHWSVAILIFAAILLGFFMEAMDFGPDKIRVIGLHKSIGLSVLALASIRIVWRMVKGAPGALKTHAKYERILAKTIHVVLYICMFLMPLSGWVMSSAGEFSVNFFGLYEMPSIWAKDEAVFKAARLVHELSVYLLMGCIALHIIGAVKHHLIERDETMRRMGANLVWAVLGLWVLLAALAIGISGKIPALSSDKTAQLENVQLEIQSEVADRAALTQNVLEPWDVDYENSAVEIVFSQYGKDVSAQFENWQADINFDANNLAQSRVMVRIDTGSLKTGSDDRDAQSQGQSWFYTERYPEAVFESESFEALGGDEYEVRGLLTIKGVTKELSFPFTLKVEDEGDYARADMEAQLSLSRADYGLGDGQWASGETIGEAVSVHIHVKAGR